jgi:hypothetical protein
MRAVLRKHWLLLPSGLCLLGACLIGTCWYLYGHDRIVVYPVVTLYDYTDAGRDTPDAWAALLFFTLSSGCLLFLWMRGMGFARRFRRLLLAGAIVCLLASGLLAIWLSDYLFINLNREGYSGVNQHNGSTWYWHLRYPAELRQDSVQNAVLERFQCDDHLLLCHFSSSEPSGP